jgi:hypothetical protein
MEAILLQFYLHHSHTTYNDFTTIANQNRKLLISFLSSITDVASPLSSWISIETIPNYDDFPHLFLSEQLAKSDLGPISIGWLVGFSDPITPGSVDL